MEYKVIIIDDNDVDPLERTIKREFKNEVSEVKIFEKPSEGLKFILNNLNERMIVFLDWNFDADRKNGVNILSEIRKKTSLLSVILMSANNISQNISKLKDEEVLQLINETNMFYYSRSGNDHKKNALELIRKIKEQWISKFDCILEDWLIKNPEDNSKIAFSQAGGKSYSWEQILIELRNQTSVGKAFEEMINGYNIRFINKLKK